MINYDTLVDVVSTGIGTLVAPYYDKDAPRPIRTAIHIAQEQLEANPSVLAVADALCEDSTFMHNVARGIDLQRNPPELRPGPTPEYFRGLKISHRYIKPIQRVEA